jgi:predicted nucleic-acid-binding protein
MNGGVGLDTYVLARYYVEPAADDAAERRQCEAARQMIESGQRLSVCKTVLLELEWVLRGYYGYAPAEISTAFAHLLAQAHIDVEDRSRVEQAVRNYAAGLDFADALHHASYADCRQMTSFDDQVFARRSRKLGLSPPVILVAQKEG